MSIKISYSLLAPSLRFVACKRFPVAPRGRTQWVPNAEAAGEVTLKNFAAESVEIGFEDYRPRLLTPAEKPPTPAGSPLEAFAKLTESCPAFELQPV
jgi:hypothetical protein